MWQRRHRVVLGLLAAHAAGLVLYGLYMGATASHVVVEGLAVATFGAAAAWPRLHQRARSTVAALGLMTASAVLVHLSGGYIEAHFHFFVMLGVIFLYEDWLPYVLAVGYVAAHHGIAGTLDPLSVYNHPSAISAPWTWAGIHAVFIFGLSMALIVAWNVIERARRSETLALSEAQELKRQLHNHEKMAALGSLVAGLAHEVRTPLTIVGTNASILEMNAKRNPDDPFAARVVAHTHEIREGVDRINALVAQLRRFHALAPDQTRELPLDEVVRDAVRLFRSANKTARVLEVDLQPTPLARLDALGVHQVVLNLMTNAVDATDQDGVVHVRTYREGDAAVLVVEDDGMGMPPETLRKAFDPLFTTKSEGMGLGLHIVKRIAEAHGAHIACTSQVAAGTRIEVRFPVAEAAGAKAVPIDAGAASVTPSPAR